MKFLKHISKYVQYESQAEARVNRICRIYGVENYTINKDLSVDVDGVVNLDYKKLDEMPIKFGVVNGDFNCVGNQLTSFRNFPDVINGDLVCEYNQINTFDGFPKNVSGILHCAGNKIFMFIFLFMGHNRDNLIELFNDTDIIREGRSIVLDRLKWFCEEIGVDFNDRLLKDVKKYYKVIE